MTNQSKISKVWLASTTQVNEPLIKFGNNLPREIATINSCSSRKELKVIGEKYGFELKLFERKKTFQKKLLRYVMHDRFFENPINCRCAFNKSAVKETGEIRSS